MAIKSFADAGTADVFNGLDTRDARRCCPTGLLRPARRKLDALNVAPTLQDLTRPPGNRLEALKGDREGQYSIRINDQYRVCFRWDGTDAADVELVDYH